MIQLLVNALKSGECPNRALRFEYEIAGLQLHNCLIEKRWLHLAGNKRGPDQSIDPELVL